MTTKDLLRTVRTRPRDEDRMVRNTAGGLAFALDDQARLMRFLILGSDAPTYYASARTLTDENTAVVIRLAKSGSRILVPTLLDVSLNGRAKKQNPTLFALAVACASPDEFVKRQALDAIPQICRTGTMLFDFLTYVEGQRGWGRGLRSAVARWYEDKDPAQLAVQAVKYRQRNGWTHRDVLRLAHPVSTPGTDRQAVLDFMRSKAIADGDLVASAALRTLHGYDLANRANAPANFIRAVQKSADLPWEALPTQALNDPELWRQMIPTMGMTALMRNLTRFSKVGTVGVTTGDPTARIVAGRLTDPEQVRKSRLHPLAILFAHNAYRHSERPNPTIVDALDDAFSISFGNVKPTGGRTLLALDVSGSMSVSIGDSRLTAREAAAAMALATSRVEDDYTVVGFTGGNGRWGGYRGMSAGSIGDNLTVLPFGKRTSLAEAVKITGNLPFGGTDCALPMLWADAHGEKFDTIVIYTDSETWAGDVQPSVALKQYRAKYGLRTRLIVVGMTSNGFSIADPQDTGMLDVVGFDASAATLISDFARGDI